MTDSPAAVARAPGRQAALLRASRRSTPNDVVETPASLFRELDSEFHFTLDVCATARNAKVAQFFDEAADGLNADWATGNVCWCNPPYSDIGPWAERAYLEAAHNLNTTVMLVPVWSDRLWFHAWALRATEIRFIQGRISFPGYRSRGKNSSGNPYAYCLIIFRRGAVAP